MKQSKAQYSALEADADFEDIYDSAPEEDYEPPPVPYSIPNQTTGNPQISHDTPSDLQSILAQLSQYAATPQQPPPNTASSEGARQIQIQQSQGLPLQQQQAPPSFIARSLDPRLDPQRHQTATPPNQTSKTPAIDPASILEWPQALRCVNKLSAQNPSTETAIKRMIFDQENNVKQWWKDREALLVRQAGRVDSVKELNETIKAIGGTPASPPTPEEDQAERDTFDKKVYKASLQMHNHHAVELKKLGVPFFGVNPNFIIATELQQTIAARDPLSKAMITQEELSNLQRKMVQYLEDLYKD
ncbi:hypothetical protein EJ08DRAFT_660140 [Tothia fuscella]|uniref:Uncharacterized protein n=1 Tax=Tothia fuscella TaxID=1048955 RepID=A0A9P4NT99_9PEZI|nr:hypothetical protein EJ08DRAFT_660140 [Tothia fuscella]